MRGLCPRENEPQRHRRDKENRGRAEQHSPRLTLTEHDACPTCERVPGDFSRRRIGRELSEASRAGRKSVDGEFRHREAVVGKRRDFDGEGLKDRRRYPRRETSGRGQADSVFTVRRRDEAACCQERSDSKPHDFLRSGSPRVACGRIIAKEKRVLPQVLPVPWYYMRQRSLADFDARRSLACPWASMLL